MARATSKLWQTVVVSVLYWSVGLVRWATGQLDADIMHALLLKVQKRYQDNPEFRHNWDAIHRTVTGR